MPEQPFAYDEVIYPNYLHSQTHPDRLATMSKFFGVKPKPIENCRVLELGCGTGSSLISFAFDLRGSEFIGIDFSEKQIERGKAAAEQLGLKNLTFRQGDIMNMTPGDFGEFDYIIAHGLYSWVPDQVRDRILKICREFLAEQGVAFVSYNALPGCHFRLMLREMILFHTRNLTSPVDKANQSLALMKFIAQSASDENYQNILQEEFEKLKEKDYQTIFHDDLSEFNHPVYFYQFAQHAARNGLQFVTEIGHFKTKNLMYPREVLEVLAQVSEDQISLEQYLDFINGTRFRQTLLCRRELDLNPQPDPKVLREILIASPFRPVSEKPDLATSKHETFVGQKGEKVEIDHPLSKAALFHLGRTWNRSVTFDELLEACRDLLAEESGTDFEISEEEQEALGESLLQIFSTGMLRFHVHEPAFAREVSEKPLAHPIARLRIADDDSIPTLLSTKVKIKDSLGKELIRLLDGTRDHRQLLIDLTKFINSKDFAEPAEIKRNILRELPEQLEKSLQEFAKMALLMA